MKITNEANRTHYDEKYSKLSLYVSPAFAQQFQWLLRYFAPQYLAAPTACRLLDLGSGTGEYAKVLANLGYDVTCFDFSAVAVAKASELGLKAICGDFYTYPFQPAYHIAFARSFSCLNTNQQEDFLRNVARIPPCLLPGGVALYMGYSNLSGAWDSGNWYHLSPTDLERFFGKGRYLVLPFARKQLGLPISLNRLISQWACRTQPFGGKRNTFVFAQLPIDLSETV